MSRRVEEPGSRRQCIAAFDYRRALGRHAACRPGNCGDTMGYDDQVMTFISNVKFDYFPVCNIWGQLHRSALCAYFGLHHIGPKALAR